MGEQRLGGTAGAAGDAAGERPADQHGHEAERTSSRWRFSDAVQAARHLRIETR